VRLATSLKFIFLVIKKKHIDHASSKNMMHCPFFFVIYEILGSYITSKIIKKTRFLTGKKSFKPSRLKNYL
jgi:hypothetical protein